MCTMVYSINSHRKIVHHPHCSVVRWISKESRCSFDSFDDAQAHGYRLCNCCPSIAKKYRKERRLVDDYCRSHGFTFKLLNGVIHVISRHDCWRLITNGEKNNLSCQRIIEKAGGTKIGAEATEFDRVIESMILTLKIHDMVEQVNETRKLLDRNNGIYAYIYEFAPEP